MKKILCMLVALSAPTFGVLADDDLGLGPGVFTGEKGAFTIFNSDKSEKSTKKEITESLTDSKNLSQKEEFELFKMWKKLKDEKSESYQEFLLWVEYKKVINHK